MENPYDPSERESLDTVEKQPSHLVRGAPIVGCISGGCLIPILLFLFCGIVLNDTGGPLIWPILSVFFGLLGLLVGLAIRLVRK